MQNYRNAPAAGDRSGASVGRVYVVDDDAGVRDSISRLLRSLDLDVKTFPSVGEFRAKLDDTAPACLLLDIRMPGMSGLELQNQLPSFAPNLPVIFVTGHADVPTSVRVMKAGAIDLLQKPWSEQALLDAVFAALERSRSAAQESSEREIIEQRFGTLTPREREVMAHVVRGLLNKQIAHELGLQLITVKIHRSNLMRKMKASSMVELVAQAKIIGQHDKS